ncbi:MAG: hypothetical protein LJE94_13215 [Deltaproteobacteria bacterium]|nr:hypothetical protein [Deltaproteobacteria bacterium]
MANAVTTKRLGIMAWIRPLLAACVLVTIAATVQAQVPGVAPQHPYSFSGYVKFLSQAVAPGSGSTAWDHLVHQRLDAEYRWSDSFSLAAGVRNRLLWGDSLDIPAYEKSIEEDPGHFDLSWNWLNEDNLIGNTIFDRLYLDWQGHGWQARGGRQRINWGMATLWNPNDLFNVYSMFDFDYEERPGTDALTMSRSLGFASRAEAVWGVGDDWDDTSLAAQYRFNVRGYDLQVLGGKQRVDLVLGSGFSGSLWGAGLYGEVSYFYPYRDTWKGVDQEQTTVATLEADYSVAGRRNLTWRISVLYTGNPEDPGSTLVYLNRPLTAKNISFSRWTGYADLSFDITSLSRQTVGGALYDDGSLFLTASNAYSLADNWQLMLVWQHFDGSGDSLFGENPADLFCARIRWNF